MRRFTLVTLIVLFTLLSIAAYYQCQAGQGSRRYPGPGVPFTPTPSPTVTSTSWGHPGTPPASRLLARRAGAVRPMANTCDVE